MKKYCPVLVGLLMLFPISTVAQSMACSALNELKLPDVRIMEATAVAADPESETDVTAAHCRVLGVIGKEIRFELLLPDDWNSRFVMGGGGGFVGELNHAAKSTVNRGYATVGTDTGHQGPVFLADWALYNLERQLNFGHLAVHRTAEVAKAVIRAYYEQDAAYSYFFGCSRGGGQAMMEAQRYPDDFDGIVAGAPAFDWTGFTTEMLHNIQLNFPDPKNTATPVITLDNTRLLETKILETCDELDGVSDGVMNDPRTCTFDLDTLPSCSAGPGPDCLMRDQRAAIERIYAPVTNQDGRIYPGQPFGGESEQGGWQFWISGSNGPIVNGHWIFGTQFYKYFVFHDPDWDYTEYDFSTWEEDTRMAATFVNATDPDLSAFRDSDGKLILWHGWSDAALSAHRSIEYYDEAAALDPNLSDYFRMFLMPGVLHCAAGPGPDQADWIQTIADWVETGRVPDQVLAEKKAEDGSVVLSRPLCPYPQTAVYTGSGSTDDAENFECRE